MESKAFLTVNEKPISLGQSLRYLQAAGKLQGFVADILRQYVLEQELNNRPDLDLSPAVTEQAVVNFRLENKLTDPKVFQEWLNRNGVDYNTFHAQITNGFKLEKLKAQVVEARLQEYFIERKVFLDRVVLSRIVVVGKELAEELRSQIEEGSRFDQLAKEYTIHANERLANGMMGAVSRGTLPDGLRAAVDAAGEGELLGPLQLDEQHWALFRVEQVLPANLDDPQLRQSLQNEIFERSIAEKIQTMTVQLQVSE